MIMEAWEESEEESIDDEEEGEEEQMTIVQCPVCNVFHKQESMIKHIKKEHPEVKVVEEKEEKEEEESKSDDRRPRSIFEW